MSIALRRESPLRSRPTSNDFLTRPTLYSSLLSPASTRAVQQSQCPPPNSPSKLGPPLIAAKHNRGRADQQRTASRIGQADLKRTSPRAEVLRFSPAQRVRSEVRCRLDVDRRACRAPRPRPTMACSSCTAITWAARLSPPTRTATLSPANCRVAPRSEAEWGRGLVQRPLLFTPGASPAADTLVA